MSIEVDHYTGLEPHNIRVIISPQVGIPSGTLTFWLTKEESVELAEKLKHPMHTVEADKS